MFRRRREDARTTSIHDHIRAHLRPDGPGLRDGGEALPDDAEQTTPWAPGARDGVLTHHWGGAADPAEVDRVVAAVLSGEPARVEEAVADVSVVALVEDLLTRVRAEADDPELIHGLGMALATRSARREAVKAGIALLGMFDASHHRDVLLTLGRHDEFTLFAAVALGNGDGDPEAVLWDLARRVTGWGRVHLVERLSATENPELRDWILREGFRNDVMDEYLAGIAAETGGLADALAAPAAGSDAELMAAAAGILTALATDGGPMIGMAGYADGERATGRYLRHAAAAPADLRHYLAAHALRDHAAAHWPGLVGAADAVLARPEWPDLATAALRSPDPELFYRGDEAGRLLGVPVRPAHAARLRDDPFAVQHWVGALGGADTAEAAPLIAWAAEVLPLAEIATGPGTSLGVGPDHAPHRALGAVVDALDGHPGLGWPLVAAALRCPVTSARNAAARTLDAWGDARPPEAADALRRALAEEPDDDLRGRLRALAGG
ncbi:hypothetical protein [Actinomadura atramentaria]|uniref:hypothetical protein n=1 Tax=Actinomadura atramentaria TaxID=1990 RepID=UPI0003787650|nr:hypothetical protein [Actinomadura atramentaria]